VQNFLSDHAESQTDEQTEKNITEMARKLIPFSATESHQIARTNLVGENEAANLIVKQRGSAVT